MEKFFAHPSAEIDKESEIGQGTKIWHQAQIMPGVKIGEECNLGKSVYIDSGVKIGSRVKIQNGVSVYKGVTIESDCFLGPHMVFTNDLFPRSFNQDFEIVPTLVKEGASIGANATIICGVTLNEFCMVGSGSVVTKDVPPFTLVVGNPARPISMVCRCGKKSNEELGSLEREPKCPKC